MIVSKQTKVFFSIAAFMMALAISIGAFGAHGLKPYLDAYGLEIYTKATWISVLKLAPWILMICC